jgi:hypothetical protein
MYPVSDDGHQIGEETDALGAWTIMFLLLGSEYDKSVFPP